MPASTKKPAWLKLSKPERAQFLADRLNLPDSTWTKQKRKKGETRLAFIARLHKVDYAELLARTGS